MRIDASAKYIIDYAKEMHNDDEKHWEAFVSSIIDPTDSYRRYSKILDITKRKNIVLEFIYQGKLDVHNSFCIYFDEDNIKYYFKNGTVYNMREGYLKNVDIIELSIVDFNNTTTFHTRCVVDKFDQKLSSALYKLQMIFRK